MKKLILLFLITFFAQAQTPTRNIAGFGAGFTTNNMHASAIIEARSTSKGVLFPRMTTTQRDAISSPATSLIIFNTTTGAYNYYNGTIWTDLGSGATPTIGQTIVAGSNATNESLSFDDGGDIVAMYNDAGNFYLECSRPAGSFLAMNPDGLELGNGGSYSTYSAGGIGFGFGSAGCNIGSNSMFFTNGTTKTLRVYADKFEFGVPTPPFAPVTTMQVTTPTANRTITFKDESGTVAYLSDITGGGTVTSVSVVTANGVTGSVANATTTPAITLSLGAITPTSVNVSGATASTIAEFDASKNLVSATKGTAYNKNFGTGITNIPEIGTTLTASKVLVTDGSGKLAPSSVTTTTLGYLDATSSIQTQMDNHAVKALLKDNSFWYTPFAIFNATSFGFSSNSIGQTFVLAGNAAGTKGMTLFATTSTAGTIASKRRNDAWQFQGLEFKLTQKIQFQTNISGQRFFCGLTKGNQFSAPTNVDQTALTDIAGVAQLSTSTNMHVIHNDASGTATTIDLGSSYPCNDPQYDYFITIEQTTTTYNVTVERVTVSTGASISTSNTLSTNIPVYNTGAIQICSWISNNATASIASYLDGGGYGTFKN